MSLEEDPLRLVFLISKELVNFYESMSNEDMLKFVIKHQEEHKFFLMPCAGEKVTKARVLFSREFFGRYTNMRIDKEAGDYLRLVALIPRAYDVDRASLAENLFLLFKIVNELAKNYHRPTAHAEPLLMAIITENYGFHRQGISGYYTLAFQEYLEYLLTDNPRLHQDYHKVTTEAKQVISKAYNLMRYGYGIKPIISVSEDIDFLAQVQDATVRNEKNIYFRLATRGKYGPHVCKGISNESYPTYSTEQIFPLGGTADSTVEQISLLAGLAYFCGSARQWLA